MNKVTNCMAITGHKNAANMTLQNKRIEKYKTKLKSILQMTC